MTDKLLKIVEHYGVMPQLKYFQSEVFELSEAIINCNTYDEFAQADMNVFRENREYFLKHIAEEIADVLVMVYQFLEYYKIDQVKVCKTMDFKIDRQLERIKNGR